MRRFLTLLALFLPLSVHAQEASLVPQYLQTLKPRCIGPANMSGRYLRNRGLRKGAAASMYVARPAFRAACGRRSITAPHGSPFSTSRENRLLSRARLSPSARRIPISSGPAPARPTRATASPGGTASTARPTAASRGSTWGSKRPSTSAASSSIRRIPMSSTSPPWESSGRFQQGSRGVFKTSDAGKTWEHVLAVNADTGLH